jgi:hypothetical protein
MTASETCSFNRVKARTADFNPDFQKKNNSRVRLYCRAATRGRKRLAGKDVPLADDWRAGTDVIRSSAASAQLIATPTEDFGRATRQRWTSDRVPALNPQSRDQNLRSCTRQSAEAWW